MQWTCGSVLSLFAFKASSAFNEGIYDPILCKIFKTYKHIPHICKPTTQFYFSGEVSSRTKYRYTSCAWGACTYHIKIFKSFICFVLLRIPHPSLPLPRWEQRVKEDVIRAFNTKMCFSSDKRGSQFQHSTSTSSLKSNFNWIKTLFYPRALYWL